MTEPRRASPRGEDPTSSHRSNPIRKPKDPGRSVAFWTIVGSIAGVLSLLVAILSFKSDGGATPTSTDSAAVRIQACETTHHLTAATVQQQPTADTTIFATCDWPPAPGADPDGYTAVANTLVSLSGGSDATNNTQVRRITGPCAQFELKFTYAHMGDMTRLPVLTISRDSVIQIGYTAQAPYDRSKLPFYPDRGEIDVVQNDNLILDHAGCSR